MFTDPVTAALSAALSAIPQSPPATLSPASRAGGGDFQCNAVLAAASRAGLSPRDLAETVADSASAALDGIATVRVSGRGFLNVSLEDEYICASAAGKRVAPAPSGERVVLDFGGPNIAKPLHVGHLRSFVIGESLRRILAAAGHEVMSDIHFGDWGLQIGKVLVGRGAAAFDPLPAHFDVNELGALYRKGNDACGNDPASLASARAMTLRLQEGDPAVVAVWREMRETSLAAVMEHARDLDARFDILGAESDTREVVDGMIDDLVAAGLATEDDGALVGPRVGDRPPLILRTRDGAALYATTDLATIRMRIEAFRPDRIVYCTDDRQIPHFQSVFALAGMAAEAGVRGFSPLPRLVHAPFGTVRGGDGKPYKTRDGNPVELSALLAKATERALEKCAPESAAAVGVGALKFADLSTERLSGYTFDEEGMLAFNGRTGPYLQYALARVSSLLRKARGDGGAEPGKPAIRHPADRALLLACLNCERAATRAAEELEPKSVADAAYAVASAVAELYARVDVLRAAPEERAGRLGCLECAKETLSQCLSLLGIAALERM